MNKLCARIFSMRSPVAGWLPVQKAEYIRRAGLLEVHTFDVRPMCRSSVSPPTRQSQPGPVIRPDDPQMGRILFSRLWQSIEVLIGSGSQRVYRIISSILTSKDERCVLITAVIMSETFVLIDLKL
jgi:hypothetical protein